jgi:hypothetical protein
LRRLRRLGALPPEAVASMLAWPHGGFSLDGSRGVEASDRRGLERLLRYCTRPPIAAERLEYDAERNQVRYRTGAAADARVLELEPLDFLRRLSALIPPPGLRLVRHAGALAPRAALRPSVVAAAQAKVPLGPDGGFSLPAPTQDPASDSARESKLEDPAHPASPARSAWAFALARVFEIDVLSCDCGGRLRPVAAILSDAALLRILRHLGLPTDLPVTRPARPPPSAPPSARDDLCQVDPRVDAFDGIDPPCPDDATC